MGVKSTTGLLVEWPVSEKLSILKIFNVFAENLPPRKAAGFTARMKATNGCSRLRNEYVRHYEKNSKFQNLVFLKV